MSDPVAPTIHLPGQGERLEMGDSGVTLKATSENTVGGLYLSEAELGAGQPGPPPHTHKGLCDMFYVLEGTLTVQAGHERRQLPAGSFVAVPPGNVHTFANESDAPVRFLNFSSPGGFEGYMRDLFEAGRESGGMPSLEQFAALIEKHDLEIAG